MSLKDSRLIKINFSKKKLDTARKSRLQQLQDNTQTTHTISSSLLQAQ